MLYSAQCCYVANDTNLQASSDARYLLGVSQTSSERQHALTLWTPSRKGVR